MLLTEKEMSVLKDLQTQEKNCIDKYEKYAGLAKDEELKQLFEELKKKEQEHYKTIGQMLNGEVPSCDCNDTAGKGNCFACAAQAECNWDRQKMNLEIDY